MSEQRGQRRQGEQGEQGPAGPTGPEGPVGSGDIDEGGPDAVYDEIPIIDEGSP